MNVNHRLPRTRQLPSLYAVLLVIVCCNAVIAQEPCDDCVAVGGWQLGISIGLGMRSNPLVDGKNIPLVVIPKIAYYGERFFIENLDLGYTLKEGKHYQFNLLASPGYDRLYFEREDIRNLFLESTGSDALGNPNSNQPQQTVEVSLDDRDLAILAGGEFSWWNDANTLQLQLLQDVSDTHDGLEVRAAWQRGWLWETQRLSMTVGLTWKSAKLLDYYYGVRAHEAWTKRPRYEANSGLNSFIRLGWRHPLNNNWTLKTDIQYDSFSNEMSESPLVEDSSSLAGFVGVEYRIK